MFSPLPRPLSILAKGLGLGLVLGLFVGQSAAWAERGPRANYLLRCSGCHGQDGTGLVKAGIPPFPNFVAPLIADDEGRTYVMHVPGVVASGLTDSEIASVMNYVSDTWGTGDKAAHFTVEEVTERRARPVPDIVTYRRAIVKRLGKEGIELAEYPWP
ncbi:c-type cytochrome [Rhodospirillum sp. A1_3_36]|uniref:c-type cytochrome n=1 Tax=Rhodospirillum sp. A1_3_36 TaxID=3391666 RepID=UPI0039A4CA14